MNQLGPVLDAFFGLSVLVLGDPLLDEYLHGGETRICREAPVPVVTVHERRAVAGGAANVAANAAAQGARVRFVSVVGDDADGRALSAALRAAGVDPAGLVVDPARTTVAKRRLIGDQQLVVRFDEGAPAPLSAAASARVRARLPALFAAADVVVVSDYGYGTVSDEMVDALADLQRTSPRVLVVDGHDIGRYRRAGATAVTPTYDEARTVLADLPAQPADRAAAASALHERLCDATGARVVAVTLDRDGGIVCERGRPPYRTWTRPVPHSRACGAGDSFATAFALALGAGADVPVAAEVGQAAAAVVTGRDGTSVCSLDDLREHLADASVRLEPVAQLVERVGFHRRQGRRIVFTNGCFDLLHRGHVDLLNRAKARGDVLIVGINSDDSIARLKGPQRPINRLEDRAGVLAGLSAVDHLVAFDDTTAVELVTRLRPDVYVKGGDYTDGMVPEVPHVTAYGGRVEFLPYLEDRSTTSLIERIRDARPAARPLDAVAGEAR